MAIIEWLGADKPETTGPEKYAPKNGRAPEKLSDVDGAAASMERSAVDPANVEKLNEVMRHVSGAAMEEIDQVIRELESVRDMLRTEGERVSREVASYASLSHAAVTAMKVISDSLTLWKNGRDKSGPRPVADGRLL